jgi:hypothetical protein
LKAAEDALASVKQARDDAIKGYTDQYASLPGIEMTDKDGNALTDQLGPYTQAVANQITAVQTYKDTLDQLRSLGLDDATYQKLLSEGTADQQFANQLLAGGKTAVDGLNALDSQLKTASEGLATNAGHNLYDAGIAAAQGLVDGLNAKLNDPDPNKGIIAAIEAIADDIIKRLKKKLHIKSPSRVFAEIGTYSMLGLAKGLNDSSKSVTDAVSSVGDDALSTMRDSMSKISEMIASGIDTNPTITPVLDLTQVQKGAQQIGKAMTVAPISADSSYGLAAQVDIPQVVSSDGSDANAPTIQFVQNNTSPKALSETEIYRQTNNQLSQAKNALGLNPK